MAKNFRLLMKQMSPRRRAQIEARTQEMIKEIPLDHLREARQLTQENLAEILNISQAAVSKMERRTDIYLSTLERFISAMGGYLQVRAIFPEGAINICCLSEQPRRELRDAAQNARSSRRAARGTNNDSSGRN